MQTKHSTVLTTVQHVQAFMTTNADALGGLNTSDSRRALDAIEETLRTQAVTQATGKSGLKAEVAKQRVLRNTLKTRYLTPIAKIAAAQLSQVPDFAALKLPRGVNTAQKLIASAVSMGDAADKYASTFVGAGMAPTFVADLNAAADDLRVALIAKSTTKSTQFGATTGLKVAAQSAHKLVNQLDALIEAQLATNQSLLAQWKAVKRFSGKTAAITATALDAGAITSPPAPSGGTSAAGNSGPPPAPAPTTTPPAVASTPPSAVPTSSVSPIPDPSTTPTAA